MEDAVPLPLARVVAGGVRRNAPRRPQTKSHLWRNMWYLYVAGSAIFGGAKAQSGDSGGYVSSGTLSSSSAGKISAPHNDSVAQCPAPPSYSQTRQPNSNQSMPTIFGQHSIWNRGARSNRKVKPIRRQPHSTPAERRGAVSRTSPEQRDYDSILSAWKQIRASLKPYGGYSPGAMPTPIKLATNNEFYSHGSDMRTHQSVGLDSRQLLVHVPPQFFNYDLNQQKYNAVTTPCWMYVAKGDQGKGVLSGLCVLKDGEVSILPVNLGFFEEDGLVMVDSILRVGFKEKSAYALVNVPPNQLNQIMNAMQPQNNESLSFFSFALPAGAVLGALGIWKCCRNSSTKPTATPPSVQPTTNDVGGSQDEDGSLYADLNSQNSNDELEQEVQYGAVLKNLIAGILVEFLSNRCKYEVTSKAKEQLLQFIAVQGDVDNKMTVSIKKLYIPGENNQGEQTDLGKIIQICLQCVLQAFPIDVPATQLNNCCTIKASGKGKKVCFWFAEGDCNDPIVNFQNFCRSVPTYIKAFTIAEEEIDTLAHALSIVPSAQTISPGCG